MTLIEWICEEFSKQQKLNQSKSNPITGLDRFLDFQEVETPRFLDNRHMKVVRLSALCTGRFNPPGNMPGTHFCWRLSRPSAIVRPKGLCQWKILMTPSGIEPATFRQIKVKKGRIVPVHAMKACRGSRVIAPHIISFRPRWRWVFNITPRPLYPRRHNTWYPLKKKLGAKQIRSQRSEK
jgi:hypothetical protein